MELTELYKELSDFNESYRTRLQFEMARILSECGLDKDVEAQGKVGVIKIESNAYTPNSYRYNFYKYTKSGEIAKNSTYTGVVLYADKEEKLKEELLDIFKPHVKESLVQDED